MKIDNIEYIDFDKGSTSNILISNDKKLILKKINSHNEHDVLKREINILEILNDNKIDWCPQIINYTSEYIIMTYTGEQLCLNNIPNDYKSQMQKILDDLDKLNIQHNDIFHSIEKVNLTVNNNKLYLIDYGWSSIDNDFSCKIGINDEKKPCGIFLDKDTIQKLDLIFNEKQKRLHISTRRNERGSQKEIPTLKINGNNIIIGGYQIFSINIKTGQLNIVSKPEKYKKMGDVLETLYDHKEKSVIDIGCSSGLVSFILNNIGYKEILAVDHDEEYLNIIKKVVKEANIRSIKPIKYSFGDNIKSGDIVIMLGLIHWVYSCTALYGFFDGIFAYLKSITNEYLLIEWIDIDDGAIKSFNHIKFNQDIIKEEYNVINFEKSILKHFKEIISKQTLDGNTRILYIIKK